MTLKGKKAIVTGATSGIGLEIALALVKEGVFTILVGRHFEQVNELLTKHNFPEGSVELISTDLTSDYDLDKLFSQTAGIEIDMLIHCAGVISLGTLEDLNKESLDHQYQVNVRAPFAITKNYLPALRKNQGDIVFINSTAGLDAWETVSQYAASKHALRAMTDSLRKEVAKDKIRVASLYLGSVDTPMQESVQKQYGNEDYDAEQYMHTEEIAQAVLSILNMPKRASITDITIRQNR